MEKRKIYVIKLGSTTILNDYGINKDVVNNLIKGIKYCNKKGIDIVLVVSGAVAYGKMFLGCGNSNNKQLCATIGQAHITKEIGKLFEEQNMQMSQLLLTRQDFSDREHYKAMKTLLFESINFGIISLINENDAVCDNNLNFTDNDQLSAMLAGMLGAERLIILSDIKGLYKNYYDEEKIEIVKLVKEINKEILSMVSTKKSKLGRGGMLSKLKTAKLVMDMGIEMNLTYGKECDVLQKIYNKKNIGTLFVPQDKKEIDPIKKWLKAGANPIGKIVISTVISDLVKQKKRASILVIGVEEIVKDFKKGDIVEVCSDYGQCVGVGISKIDSCKIMFYKKKEESKIVIHTDYFMYVDEFEKSF